MKQRIAKTGHNANSRDVGVYKFIRAVSESGKKLPNFLRPLATYYAEHGGGTADGCRYGQATIAKHLGISRQAVNVQTRALVTFGWLTKLYREHKTCVIHIVARVKTSISVKPARHSYSSSLSGKPRGRSSDLPQASPRRSTLEMLEKNRGLAMAWEMCQAEVDMSWIGRLSRCQGRGIEHALATWREAGRG